MVFHKSFGKCQGPLNFPMTDEDARELEKELESGEYSGFRKTSINVEALLKGERSDISTISVASPDDTGDVLDPNTLDFTKFQKNPVVAYNHNYELPPIGKSLWQKRINNTWKAKTQYTSRPNEYPKDSPWFPDAIFHMVQEGTMKGKSLGGAVKWRQPTQEDADRLHFELKAAKRISEKALIWEYSVCPLGCHRDTLVEAVSKSQNLIPKEVMEMVFSEYIGDIEAYNEALEADELPMIKSFRTVDDFSKAQQDYINAKFTEMKHNVPRMIEESILRAKGKV